jgi:hypothetical protein
LEALGAWDLRDFEELAGPSTHTWHSSEGKTSTKGFTVAAGLTMV